MHHDHVLTLARMRHEQLQQTAEDARRLAAAQRPRLRPTLRALAAERLSRARRHALPASR